jgi:hypothetical protein
MRVVLFCTGRTRKVKRQLVRRESPEPRTYSGVQGNRSAVTIAANHHRAGSVATQIGIFSEQGSECMGRTLEPVPKGTLGPLEYHRCPRATA